MGTPLILKTGSPAAADEWHNDDGDDNAIDDYEDPDNESHRTLPTPATPKSRFSRTLQQGILLEADRFWSALEHEEAQQVVLRGVAAAHEGAARQGERIDKRAIYLYGSLRSRYEKPKPC